jgi:hypothetical protein
LVGDVPDGKNIEQLRIVAGEVVRDMADQAHPPPRPRPKPPHAEESRFPPRVAQCVASADERDGRAPLHTTSGQAIGSRRGPVPQDLDEARVRNRGVRHKAGPGRGPADSSSTPGLGAHADSRSSTGGHVLAVRRTGRTPDDHATVPWVRALVLPSAAQPGVL